MLNFNQSKILASRLLQGSAIAGLAAMWATGAMAQAAPGGNTQVAETVETVTVTGTAIRGIIAPVGDNVITVDRDTIEATGANDVQQLLPTIPSVTGFGNPGQGGFGSADGSGTNAPTIHSLGASASNSTLILVDDHRIPLSGLAHSLSDPSTIPTIALQRVEVLADGASSIYGSDAVAGVINFITRRNYEGAETDVEYGDGLNYNQFTASQIIGTRWDHGSFMAAYQYSSNSQLLGTDRSFVNDNQTFRGLSDLGNFYSYPATIANSSATTSPIYPYPYTAGTGIPNAATSAPYGQARYSSLLPSENRNAALVNISEDVSDWLTVSAQLNWSSRIDDLAVGRNPGANAGTGGTGVTATVYGPGSTVSANQMNPFYVAVPGSTTGTETVRVDFNQLLGPGAFTKSGTTVVYAAPEADIKLGGDWLATISGVAGATSSFSRTVGQVCASCAYLALNGTTNSAGNAALSSIPVVLGTQDLTTRALSTSTALNVWGAAGSTAAGGANTSAAVLQQLTDNNSLSQTNQNMNELNIKAGGTLFNDGAGDIKTSFGAEYRNYGIYQYTINNEAAGPSSSDSSNFSAKFGRSVYAAYAEFLIPVVSPAWNIPLVKSVDIDVSGRYDHYSDVGDTKNPKVGIDWDIIDGLKARGSYSTSFVAPALTSTGGIAGLTTESNVGYGTGTGGPASVPAGYANNGGGTAINCAAGCTVGNSTAQGITIAGPGGASVKPELGTAYSAGIDFDAGKFWNVFHGLTGNVTYWQDKLVGAITSPVMTLDTQIASLNKNLIIDPSAAQIAAAYAIPGVRVASVVAGPVTFLQYYTQQNAFNLWANGIDFNLNYAFQPNDSWGLFNVGIDGSQKLRFDQQGGGFGGAIVNNLNRNANTTFSSLGFLGRGSLGWQLDSFSSNLFVNWTQSYYQPTTSVPFTGYYKVPAYVTLDLTVAYSLPDGMFPFSGGTQLYVTADDLFNQGPPPYNNAAGYDASDASPLGRLVLIGLRKKW
ncbi:MAG TPA: TonB-dependent receptor [Rhizomicrobium sp.]|nr:TonB-dependent receptor [Rhizomicrobium sp.]